MNFLRKMRGSGKNPASIRLKEIAWSWVGAFLGISALAHSHFNLLGQADLVMIIGSFGASAVLIYGAIESPLAQPRNLMGGHVLSALVGVASYQCLHNHLWLAAAVAVATAIALMLATKTVHPPGGATALIAVIGGQKIHDLGYFYALVPVGLGALIMLLVALLINNVQKDRRYPQFWL